MNMIKVVFAFVVIFFMAKQVYAGCIGNFSFPAGVQTPEGVCIDHVEDFSLGEEQLTFISFKMTEIDFHRWVKGCNMVNQFEPISEAIEVTHLIKDKHGSKYFKKEVYVSKGYSFVWDSELYRGSITYDLEASTVYIESLQERKSGGNQGRP